MSGIAKIDIETLRRRIGRFDQSYVDDWELWMSAVKKQRVVAPTIGSVLRKWQACRPNRMRRPQGEADHEPPYLDDLITQANSSLEVLERFDLSYQGRSRNGLAGVVGISKAVLLLTEGRVGPAFDSSVRNQLGIRAPENAREWIYSLQIVSKDIEAFERANHITLQLVAPASFSSVHSGRIYDMALGPARKNRGLPNKRRRIPQ